MNLNIATKLANIFKLGLVTQTPKLIIGEHFHQTYQMTTDLGQYAVKQLKNEAAEDLIPHLSIGAKHPTIREMRIENKKLLQAQYEQSETISEYFAQHNIPAITALKFQDEAVIQIEGGLYLVYPWIDGKSSDNSEKPDVEQACKIAKILAQLHACQLGANQSTNTEKILINLDKPQYPLLENRDLGALFKECNTQNLALAEQLHKMENWLFQVNDQYIQAIEKMPKQAIISHTELHFSKVIWSQHNQPYVIDWERAGYINPEVELFETCLEWGGIRSGQVDISLIKAMLQAYQENNGIVQIQRFKLCYQITMGHWLNWLVFNLERFLSDPDSQNESLLHINHSLELLNLLKSQEQAILKHFS